MLGGGSGRQAVRQVCLRCRTRGGRASRGDFGRTATRRPYGTGQKEQGSPSSRRGTWIVFAAGAGAGTALLGNQVIKSEALTTTAGGSGNDDKDNQPVIEQPRKRRDGSKEANRDAISSQHVQVKQSWENPGVFAFGSNSGGVADPGSKDAVVRNPRRIAFFDGHALRDLKLDRNFGAAVDGKGDLYVWGSDYSPDCAQPEKVLAGKGLRRLAISRDRIFALSAGGRVFSVPVSKADQAAGDKPYEPSWIPFWPRRAAVAYKTVDLPDGGGSWGERVVQVESGLEHALLLTSSGRLFSLASSSSAYPSRGQLGVPGIAGWETRPAGLYDKPHPVATLQGFKIAAVAAGDYHSLALDDGGRVFGFGDNSSGQLGMDVSPEAPYVDCPSLQNTARLYAGTGQVARVTGIAAGGSVSFLTVDATRMASANDSDTGGSGDGGGGNNRAQLGRVTADVWACGQGIYGTLGTGRWTHVQGTPARVRSLSGLFEYDERRGKIVPIRVARISVGGTHASATLANATHVGATARSGLNDVNWGADVLWWGGNEFYQLGTGRRANVNVPAYIGPLEAPTSASTGAGEGENNDSNDGEGDGDGDGNGNGNGDGEITTTKRSSSRPPPPRRDQQHRLHLTPPTPVTLAGGARVPVEQRVECGRMLSAVYSRIVD